MALPSATISFPSTSISTFQDYLKSSKRIMALLGAGLSASSGLATFRGVGSDGLWHKHDPAKLATRQAFVDNPELVWRFYQERRKQTLEAKPNRAHVAIAKLAEAMGAEGFMALSMNIDALCSRAGHPSEQLLELHGSLFDLRCFNQDCDYVERKNVNTSLIPGSANAGLPSELSNTPLPKCPKCRNLLRPDIVWFGESMSKDVVAAADSFIADSDHIDLILVIGTTAQVWPAAGYVDSAIEKGARVAMINIDRGDLVPGGGELGLTHKDWFFVGNAAAIVPEVLKPVVGEI
jgi:NAD-dependent SIR2 family protein deacetylase